MIGQPTLAYDGPTSRFLGLLATVLGRYDQAERHFTDSQALCEAMGARLFLAHNDVDYARLLLRRNHSDDRPRAQTLLQRSLSVARDHDYRAVERHATDLLTQLERS